MQPYNVCTQCVAYNVCSHIMCAIFACSPWCISMSFMGLFCKIPCLLLFLQCVAVCCSVFSFVTYLVLCYPTFMTLANKHCNTLQQTPTHCNTLQHSATRCSSLLALCVWCGVKCVVGKIENAGASLSHTHTTHTNGNTCPHITHNISYHTHPHTPHTTYIPPRTSPHQHVSVESCNMLVCGVW